jgi:hypothetical protein
MTSKKWNWQQDDWPDFSYDKTAIDPLETEFVKASGISIGVMRHLSKKDLDEFRIEMICSEALKISEIEGAFLDRDSLQSSICKEFGLGEKYLHGAVKPEEAAIAMMMKDLYTDFNSPLTHEPLWAWHDQLLNGRTDLERGKYRTGTEDMRVVSGRIDKPNIHFIAPPASEIPREMDLFIRWFNKTAPGGKAPLPPLTRAGTAHLYFVTIHKTNQITPWLCYFGKTIIKAQKQCTMISRAEKEAFVWIWLPGETEPVVAGRFEADRGNILFNYGKSYLDRAKGSNPAIAVYEPELPLKAGEAALAGGIDHARLYQGCLA